MHPSPTASAIDASLRPDRVNVALVMKYSVLRQHSRNQRSSVVIPGRVAEDDRRMVMRQPVSAILCACETLDATVGLRESIGFDKCAEHFIPRDRIETEGK